MSGDDDEQEARGDLIDATRNLVDAIIRSSQAGLPISIIAAEAGLSEEEVAEILEDGKPRSD